MNILNLFTSEFILGSLAIAGLVFLVFTPYAPYIKAILELKKARKMCKQDLCYNQGEHLFICYKNGSYQITLKRANGIRNTFGYISALFLLLIFIAPPIFLAVGVPSYEKFDFTLDWPILILFSLPTVINAFYSIFLLYKLSKKAGGFKVLLLLIDNHLVIG